MQDFTDLNGLPKDQLTLMMQIGFTVVRNVVANGVCHVTRFTDGEFHFHDPAEFQFQEPVLPDDMGDQQVASELLRRGFEKDYIKNFIRRRRTRLDRARIDRNAKK